MILVSVKPAFKRKESELDRTLSDAVEFKKSKADSDPAVNPKRRRSPNSSSQVTPTIKRSNTRSADFSLRLDDLEDLASPPRPSIDLPSFCSGSYPESDGMMNEDEITRQTEYFISSLYNKYIVQPNVLPKSNAHLKTVQECYESSPAPVRRMISAKTGLSSTELQRKIYGDVSVYG